MKYSKRTNLGINPLLKRQGICVPRILALDACYVRLSSNSAQTVEDRKNAATIVPLEILLVVAKIHAVKVLRCLSEKS